MNSDHVATIRGLLEAAIAGTESTIRTRDYHRLRAFAITEEEWLSRYRAALLALDEAAGWEDGDVYFECGAARIGTVGRNLLVDLYGDTLQVELPDDIRIQCKRQPAQEGDG